VPGPQLKHLGCPFSASDPDRLTLEKALARAVERECEVGSDSSESLLLPAFLHAISRKHHPTMFLSRPSGLATINLLLSTALAQTFSDLPLAPPISNTSDACNDALNTTVSCPAILGTVSVEYVNLLVALRGIRKTTLDMLDADCLV